MLINVRNHYIYLETAKSEKEFNVSDSLRVTSKYARTERS